MKEFEKWFKKGEQDLFTIEVLLKLENCPAEICCFHAQQAAEKYLKAYLISKQIGFPKIHDLIKLVLFCTNTNPIFTALDEVALKLTDYAVTPRYLDDTHEPTLQDAREAFHNALTIKDFVSKNFM